MGAHSINKQRKYKNGQLISRGIEWTDYTWNPIAGCHHGCRWLMPDGKVARCYAEDTANGLAQNVYPHGFEHHYWKPEQLDQVSSLKDASKIFVGSMADIFGHWVPDDQINQLLDVFAKNPQHVFQLLTKNAPRLLQFNFPENVWVGVSSPPDWMHGKRLTRAQQERMLRRSLETLANTSGGVRWMSFEPLSWHVATIVADYPGVLDWAVIGAASNGNAVYPPQTSHLESLLDVLNRQGVPVFFKGNLKHKPWAKANWREDFPDAPSVEIVPEGPVQLELL